MDTNMAPLVVEGDTLGQKHKNYNKLLNNAIKNNPTQQITSISYEEPDLDNLFKIDIACYNRNIEYILEVLKCADMLYVSRVIKKSTWLITDQQYSYIINSEYLYNHLYPQMTCKAFNKLILHIRLNLRDETRVEEFFDYYKQKDLKKALKWLPHCSISFTESIIQIHADEISNQLLKRLCEKSSTFLGVFCRSYKSYYKWAMLATTMFLLNKNVDKFLDVIEKMETHDIPHFGSKYTKKVMEKNPERIMENLEKYVHVLDVATFAKFLRKEDVKDFILTQLKNKKRRSWFIFKNIKYFVNRLPIEERFDFIKRVFIDKIYEDENLENEKWDDIVEHCCPPVKGNGSSAKNIYSWYVYAPFSKAFGDLKQLIRNESNPAERILIFRVMLICAGNDNKNLLTLIKYYRENHINEPFKFKIQFVDYVLTKTDTHKYDNETWGYLNDLFYSLEVYIESKKNVQSCVKSIILYNVIHNVSIPEIIEKKFVFETLSSQNKFNDDEKEKIFDYLYKSLIPKIKIDFKSDKEFSETVDIIENVLSLLKDWNKELKDYPFVLEKIKYLSVTKKENMWNTDLSRIYNFKKSWRKLLFAESIILNPIQDSCINALKHGPELLEIYRNEINMLFTNDDRLFERFLKKIRIYWCQTLAKSFKTFCVENIDKKSNHQSLIKALCILLSQKELLNLIQKYAPIQAEIGCGQSDEMELSFRRYIATSMHLARPQPPLDLVIIYATGNYLQYILPSLNAILYNIKSAYIYEHVTEILNSLQKHGIRVACSKLKHEELKIIFSDIWKSSKNNSIRADIFNETFKLLCREHDESVILEIWDLLSMFIEELTFEENKNLYLSLGKADEVPLCVRAKFWMKSYEFLKKLPLKANSKSIIDKLSNQIYEIMEFLDNEFIAKIFLENFDKKFTTQVYDFSYQVALFLLSTKSEETQYERYVKIFVPIVEKALASWDEQHENVYFARYNLREIFDYMSSEFQNVVLNKDMVFPIAMYTIVLNKLQINLPMKDNYNLLTNIELSLGYMKILFDLKAKDELTTCSDPKESIDRDHLSKWKYLHLHTSAAPLFGRLCLEYLKENVENHFPGIYIIFADVLDYVLCQRVPYNLITKMTFLKSFLDCKYFVQGYLLVIRAIPRYLCYDDEKALQLEILNEIRAHPSKEVAMHYWLLERDAKWV